jgi:dephospho-CoA kinase
MAAHAGVIAIGLTGGIGSGKTTVAERFRALGAAIVDTDEIARSLTAPGGEAMAAVREAFGGRFMAPDGSLDRAAMRRLVFSDAAALARLESILHPAIRSASDWALAAARGPYALLVVPLLFEKGAWHERVARALAVDCDEALQVERTMARSGLSRDEVLGVMAAQWPRWRRLQVADDVIWNGAGPAALDPQCERLHRRYSSLADGH